MAHAGCRVPETRQIATRLAFSGTACAATAVRPLPCWRGLIRLSLSFQQGHRPLSSGFWQQTHWRRSSAVGLLGLALLGAGCQSTPKHRAEKVHPAPSSANRQAPADRSETPERPRPRKAATPRPRAESRPPARPTADPGKATPAAPSEASTRADLPSPAVAAPPPAPQTTRPSQVVSQHLLQEGEQLRQKGQWQEAADRFEQAQKLNSNSPQSYARLSEIALRQNRPAEAERQARMGLLVARTEAQKQGFYRLIRLAQTAQKAPPRR